MKPINLTDDEVQKLKRGELTEIVRKVSPRSVTWSWPDNKRRINHPDIIEACPYAKPNETRWVRETHWINETEKLVAYRADGEMPHHMAGTKWRNSIQMPRWASRLGVKIKTISVEKRGEWIWVMKTEFVRL